VVAAAVSGVAPLFAVRQFDPVAPTVQEKQAFRGRLVGRLLYPACLKGLKVVPREPVRSLPAVPVLVLPPWVGPKEPEESAAVPLWQVPSLRAVPVLVLAPGEVSAVSVAVEESVARWRYSVHWPAPEPGLELFPGCSPVGPFLG
jgi:hypothetical protein